MVSCRLAVIKQLCKEHVKNATICCEKVSIAELMAFWTSEWQHQGQGTNKEILGISLKTAPAARVCFLPITIHLCQWIFWHHFRIFSLQHPVFHSMIFIPYTPKIFAFPSKNVLWKKTKRSCATFLNASANSPSYKYKRPKSCATICHDQMADLFRCFYWIDSSGFKQTCPGTIRDAKLVKVMTVTSKQESNKLL